MAICTYSAKEIFFAAVERPSPTDRTAFVAAACQGNVALRQEVDALLAAHDAPDSRFDNLPGDIDALPHEFSTANQNEWVGTQIGPYVLRELLGEGGMGIVYVAEQTEPVRRKVALKIIKPGMDSRQIIARFEAERQALALMDHPHIARILDAGTVGDRGEFTTSGLGDEDGARSVSVRVGRPYFVMELVRGMPITEYCDQARLTPQQRLELFITVCQAVQHAHQKGIIHRDLKPSNILVTLHDDTPVAKVIDFGVAKALHEQLTDYTLYTAVSQIVGTPLYMSPEQAEFSGLDIDTRSDIYSLGVTLYELLTGQTPFHREQLKKASIDEMRRLIREVDPPRPSQRFSTLNAQECSTVSQRRGLDERQLHRTLRGELDWIVMKCLEKDRKRRYESASSLARDIERYLNDRPVEASPPSTVYRWKKTVRRHRAAFATALLVSLSMIVGLAASLWQAFRAHHHERQAMAAALRARTYLYMSDMNLAFEAADEGDSRRAAELLRRHIPGPDDEDLRGFEWHFLQQTVNLTPHILMDLDDYVWSLSCSPDGRRLAAACNDGKLRVCELPTGRLLNEFDCGQSVKAVCWSQDSNLVAAAIADGSVRGWNLDSSSQRFAIPAHEGEANGVLLADRDSTLITCGIDGTIRSWDVVTGMRKVEYKGHERSVESIAISPDQKWLASASSDWSVRLWNRESGKQIHNVKCDARAVSVTFSRTSSQVVAATIDGTILSADVRSGSHQVLQKCIDGVESVVLLDGGRLLAAGDRGGAIRLRSLARPIDARATGLRNLKQGQHWLAHHGRIETLAVRPGTGQLISSGRDGQILLWNPNHERTRWEVDGANDFVVSRRGELLSVDYAIRTWELDSRELVQSFGQNIGIYRSIALSSDGQYLATATADTVVVYDRERQEVARLNPGTECVKVCLSRDGSSIAVSCRSASDFVHVYRRGHSQPFRQFTIHNGSYICFSPDDTVLAAGSLNDVLLFDLDSDQPPRRLQGHSNSLVQLAFGPDGFSLASVSNDRKLMLWDWRSGQLRWSMDAHRSEVSSVAFAPDGRTLATGDQQGEIKFWHAATGQPIGGFRTEQDVIDKLAFTPDSRRLIARQRTGVMTMYDSLSTTKTLDDMTESPYLEPGLVEHQAEFTAIPGLSDPGTRIEELAVSGNGRVVAGSGRKDKKAFGFRWTFDESTSVLPSSTVVDVRCVNFDGSRILASRNGMGVCWNWPFLKQSLVLSGERAVNVSDVDASGTMIVGEVAGSAVRGNLGRFSTLPAPGPDDFATATAVSTDGSTVFGVAWPKLSKRHTLCRPVRWTGQSVEFLPGVEDQNYNWFVHCASADGRAIAGYRWPTAFGANLDAHLNMAYHWADGRVTLLGDLSGGSIASRAMEISGDGQIVVGTSHSKNGWEAFIWDQEHGMRSLEQVLLARGAELTGWKLELAEDISHNGNIIVGKGVSPNGRYQAYVARLPREDFGIDAPIIARIQSIVVKATQKETVTTNQRQELLTALFKLSEHDPQQFVAVCLSLGNQLVALNEHASAAAIYTEALRVAPHDAGLYRARGTANFRQRGFAQAASDYSTAIDQLGEDSELKRETLLVQRGFAQSRLEQFELALADFEAAYDIAPLETLKLIAGGFEGSPSAIATGIPNPALAPGIVKLVDRAESLGSDQPAEVRLARANLLAQFEQFQRASQEYELLVAASDAREVDYYSLALLAVAQNDVSGYEKWCAAMTSRFPKSRSYYRFICHSLAPPGTKGYPAAIIAAARRAAAKPPPDSTYRIALGAVLVRDGQYNDGYKFLNAAVASDATKGRFWVSRARYCLLAISHSNRGLSEKAHSYLVSARQSADTFLRSPHSWQQRLLLKVWLREATQLIEPPSATNEGVTTP